MICGLLLAGSAVLSAQNWQKSKKQDDKIFANSSKNVVFNLSSKFNYGSEIDPNIEIRLTRYHDSLRALNPDSYSFRIDSLPTGAKFNSESLVLYWDETVVPTGEYKINVYAETEGYTGTLKISISVRDDWKSFFLPALGYSVYMPATDADEGFYHGVNVQFAFTSWIHHNDNKGPSHGQWYFFLDLMQSDIEDVKDVFIYGTGVDMSFERAPKRKFLLPYFGLSLGWINQERIETRFFLNPELGLWLYADKNIFVNAKCGYMLPTTKTEEFQGLRACLSVNFSMW